MFPGMPRVQELGETGRGVPCGPVTFSTATGVQTVPPSAIAAYAVAIVSGEM